jgi:hypothetical protein
MDVLGYGPAEGRLADLTRTARPGIRTPLAPWFPDRTALARARQKLGGAPVSFTAHDRSWRSITPAFGAMVELAGTGLPFQIAAERRYDRSGRSARLRPALEAGKTVFLPQIHQVLPRVMRLMVALRAAFVGGGREECSFLFMVDGRGREGLGLHHDDEVTSFWLQLEGRRTVTLGPPVPRGTPQELADRWTNDPRFTTQTLTPGTLLYLPPRTPHRVVCYGRSLALSLTWSRRPRTGSAGPFSTWDVASGPVTAMPRASRTRVWTQIPTRATATRDGVTVLALPDGARVRVPGGVRRFADDLASMSSFPRAVLAPVLPALLALGVVAAADLPIALRPAAPRTLDGWRFA